MDVYQHAVSDVLGQFCQEAASMLSAPPRIAFIGFRDTTEGEHQFVSLDFSTNVEEVKAAIDKEMCFGGEDDCEDIVTPLKKALKLSWRSDMRIVYLVIDSPTHGKAYHAKTLTDNNEEADEGQELEKLCQHYAKNMINLVVMKCHNNVDTMIDIMRIYYDRGDVCQLQVIDVHGGWDTAKHTLKEYFKLSMSQNFAQSLDVNFGRVTHGDAQEFSSVWNPDMSDAFTFAADQSTPTFSKEPNFKSFAFKYSIVLKPTLENEQCTIGLNCFGSGKFKDCYQLLKSAQPTHHFIAKIPKQRITGLADMNRDADIETYLFTQYFVHEFNKRLSPAKLIIIRTSVLFLKDRTDAIFKGSRYIFFQQFVEGAFTKFNNNYGWVNTEVEISKVAQAFSHFSYEASKGTLIVVDIQGVIIENIIQLCDYAIHASHYKHHFGRANHGTLGIRRFFATHECNEYCKQLGLIHPHVIQARELAAQLEAFPNKKALPHIFDDHSNEDQERRLAALRAFDPAGNLEPSQRNPEELCDTRIADDIDGDPNHLG